MKAKRIKNFIDGTKNELVNDHKDINDQLHRVINHVLESRWNSKDIRNIASILDEASLYVMYKCDFDRAIREIISFVDIEYNVGPDKLQSADGSVDSLLDRIAELESQIKTLDNDNIEMTLNSTRTTERLIEQSNIIEQLTKDKSALNKQLNQLMDANSALNASNENLSSQLLVRHTFKPVDIESVDMQAFDNLHITYDIEGLNQYISTGSCTMSTDDIKQAVDRAIDIINDPIYLDPVYITSIVGGKVFSRFDVERCIRRINNNMFLNKDKLNKRILSGLVQKELMIQNRSIYVKILDRKNQETESNDNIE